MHLSSQPRFQIQRYGNGDVPVAASSCPMVEAVSDPVKEPEAEGGMMMAVPSLEPALAPAPAPAPVASLALTPFPFP